jgi:hypothetical protein
MIKAITAWLATNGRKGGKASNPRKGFGSAEVRAKAAATRAANRSANRIRDEREALRQAVMRAHAKKGRKA